MLDAKQAVQIAMHRAADILEQTESKSNLGEIEKELTRIVKSGASLSFREIRIKYRQVCVWERTRSSTNVF